MRLYRPDRDRAGHGLGRAPCGGERFAEYIRGETLARRLAFEPIAGVEPIEMDLGGHKAALFVKNLGR